MVWPILISVAVTPRIRRRLREAPAISARQILRANALVSPPMCRRLVDGRDRRGSADALCLVAQTCHGVPNHAMANDDIRDIKKRGVSAAFFLFRCEPLTPAAAAPGRGPDR